MNVFVRCLRRRWGGSSSSGCCLQYAWRRGEKEREGREREGERERERERERGERRREGGVRLFFDFKKKIKLN